MGDCGDCFQCCGFGIPCLKTELQKIKQHCTDNNITPKQSKGPKYCIYLDEDGKCQIYYVRPMVCEVFGNITNKYMECFKGRHKAERYSEEFNKYGKKVMNPEYGTKIS